MIVKASELAKQAKATDLTSALHLINGEHFAGAERVQDLLANRLPEFGYGVDFVCFKPGKFAEVRTSDSDIFNVRMRNAYDIFTAKQVVEIVRNGNYDLLHAHTPRTLLIGSIAARKLKLPLVYHVHSPVGRDSTRKFRNKINTWVETWCLKNVDAMVCVSGSLAKYMEQLGHNQSKLHVVRNGVPMCRELPDRKPPTGAWTLGTMALYRPRKGIETLLEALAKLKSRNVDVRLRAVGGFETPEYEESVKNLASQLCVESMIDWTGFQTDINAQFQKMDLFVLPSLFGEGLPMVVLESMAQGVPVVASDVEGIPEAVRDDVDGLIFKPGCPNDMADKIEDLVGRPHDWSLMSENAIQRQRNELSDVSMARGIAQVYDSVRQQT